MRRCTTIIARCITVLALLPVTLSIYGCTSGPDRVIVQQVEAGDFGGARRRAYEAMRSASREDSILARLRFGIAALVDGYPRSAGIALHDVFRALREQGLNEDSTLPGVFVGEASRIWKGEPFEQAMAYYEIAAQQAMLSEWGNMRAASSGSLFLLKNFEEVEGTSDARRALAERAVQTPEDSDYLDTGYQPIRTDFALGYLMHTIASNALGRSDEAADNYRRALEVAPWISPALDALLTARYDTILLVEYGIGPEKVSYGPDRVLTRFVPRTKSGNEPLLVRVDGSQPTAWPWVCDVNAMANRLAWRGLQDIRQIRSLLGTGMAITGGVLLTSDDSETQLVGLGLLLAGLATKATSQADTRSVEVLPQRVYLVPLELGRDSSEITLSVEGRRSTTMTFPIVPAGAPDGTSPAVHLIRIPDRAAPGDAWMTSGAVLYANEWTDRRIPGDGLPWILGGTCVRPPTHESLRRYQSSGWLTELTTADLQELYRLEGITWEIESTDGIARGHVLEGGSSLIAPVPASAGYIRLFGAPHPAYRPKSPEVRNLRIQIDRQLTQLGMETEP